MACVLLVGGFDGVDDGRVQPGGVGGRGDVDGGESGRSEFSVVLLGGECGGGAAEAPFGGGAFGGVEAGFGDDVADAKSPAGVQDAEGFGEDAGLVCGKVDDAVGDDHVDAGVREWDVFDVAVEEVCVVGSGLGGVGAGEGEHVVAGVQAVGGSAGADAAGGQQYVQAAAGAQVQDGVSGAQFGAGEWVAASEAGAQGGLGYPVLARVPGGINAGVAAGSAVVWGAARQGEPGQAGVPRDDGLDGIAGAGVGHQVSPSGGQVGAAGAGRPMTRSAAVGKQATHAWLIR